MRHVEIEWGEEARPLSVASGIMCYLCQEEHPQWWLAALNSEVTSGNWQLKNTLKEMGVGDLRSVEPKQVKKLRDALVDEHLGLWRES